MELSPTQFEKADVRRGFTLAEVLVAVALVFTLAGILLLTSKAVGNSRKRALAEQQLAMIAHAVDRYASFWPKWKVGDTVVADKGWPDFIPGRLFETSTFELQSAHHFNDDLAFDIRHLDKDITNLNPISEGNDVLNANLCLAYCLTATSGKGPYIDANDRLLLKDIQDKELARQFQAYGVTVTSPLYPALLRTGAARRGQLLVDPWGTPYRYFWVYRSPDAYTGYLPVPTADITDEDFRTAVSFVAESAGPDGKFGNVWQLASQVSDADILEAEDNPIIKP